MTLLYTDLAERISSKDLIAHYKTFSGEKEAKTQEALFLYGYTRLYGEPPPLNLKVGGRVLVVLSLGLLGNSILAGELDPELATLLTPSKPLEHIALTIWRSRLARQLSTYVDVITVD